MLRQPQNPIGAVRAGVACVVLGLVAVSVGWPGTISTPTLVTVAASAVGVVLLVAGVWLLAAGGARVRRERRGR